MSARASIFSCARLHYADLLSYAHAHAAYTLTARPCACSLHTHHRWKINASALPDGHMFLGVAAASGVTDGEAKCKTWGFSPPTGNLYIGEKLNEHVSHLLPHASHQQLPALAIVSATSPHALAITDPAIRLTGRATVGHREQSR